MNALLITTAECTRKIRTPGCHLQSQSPHYCCELYYCKCAITASKSSTTRTAISNARYSASQSSTVATVAQRNRRLSSQARLPLLRRITQPLLIKIQKQPLCTSKVPNALHTPVRCVCTFSRIAVPSLSLPLGQHIDDTLLYNAE